MTIPVGTKVLWEAPSPDGLYFPNVLKEGRVVDPTTIVYNNSNSWSVRQKVERLMPYDAIVGERRVRTGCVLVITGVYAIPMSADDVHVVHVRELVY